MATKPLAVLGGRSAEQFLTEFWQQQPLLVRDAFPDLGSLLNPDELAGLALDDTVESRIIIERSPIDWELRHGPFNEKTFKNLPRTHWTLLIQALDHQVPAVADLLGAFDFIPSWRLDDIMASFAPVGGSVGPHFDDYDVFLIQASGQRRWQIGQHCDDSSELLPELPVRVLQRFEPTQEWLLNPGDMLYLPPGLAHYGVAENDCITLSVGFRAPSEPEILDDFAHFLLPRLKDSARYQDQELALQSNPGWISPAAVTRMSSILLQLVSDQDQVSQWMGEYFSRTKYDQNPEPPEDDYLDTEVLDLLHANLSVRREESSRLLYTGDAHRPQRLFVNGETLPIPPMTHSMVLYLCKNRHYNPVNLAMFCETQENLRLLTQLLNSGVLYIEEDLYQEDED
ncbi:MAG: cupin domain-containing protein [Pseudomonadota bacterium]|nr:cupin domain-containing protein [Pseudomonadota bacterium]